MIVKVTRANITDEERKRRIARVEYIASMMAKETCEKMALQAYKEAKEKAECVYAVD